MSAPCGVCGWTQGHDPSALCAAKARRDDGIARAEAGALESWKDEALSQLEEYLRDHPDFFVDDFFKVATFTAPADLRAFGPIVLKAARSGWMEKTGEYRPSVASNLSPKPCWRSLIYAGRSAA